MLVFKVTVGARSIKDKNKVDGNDYGGEAFHDKGDGSTERAE